MVEELEAWKEFNLAMLGATAGLAGLVIVAASVNISQIVKASTLTARLAAAIAALVLALVVSGFGLIPGITAAWFGVLLIVCTLIAGIFQVHAARVIMTDQDPAARGKVLKAVVGFLPVAAYLAAGIAVIAGSSAGLMLAAAGALLAVVAAIMVSWVVLVEVLR